MHGILVSPPVKYNAATDSTSTGSPISAENLRLWLLYWDRLHEVQNNFVHLGSTLDLSEDILTRSTENVLYDPEKNKFQVAAISAFASKEVEEPGQWAIAMGPDTPIMGLGHTLPGRGLFVRLINAVPVPQGDVPLDRVLAFRERHIAERQAFLSLVDELYLDVLRAGADKPLAERQAFERLQRGINDQQRAAKSSNSIDWKLADISASFNFFPALAVGGATLAATGSPTVALEAAFRTLASGGSLQIGPSVGWGRTSKDRRTPYAYITQIRERLEW